MMLADVLGTLDSIYLLRPIIAENCTVTMTELETVYSFQGLTEIHMLLDARRYQGKLEQTKADSRNPKHSQQP
jgi:hypothetical protein